MEPTSLLRIGRLGCVFLGLPSRSSRFILLKKSPTCLGIALHRDAFVNGLRDLVARLVEQWVELSRRSFSAAVSWRRRTSGCKRA